MPITEIESSRSYLISHETMDPAELFVEAAMVIKSLQAEGNVVTPHAATYSNNLSDESGQYSESLLLHVEASR